jgi:ribosome-binding ATPase YchF (GTP1/OBG family)
MENTDDDELIAKLLEEEFMLAELEQQTIFFQKKNKEEQLQKNKEEEMQRQMKHVEETSNQLSNDYEMNLLKEKKEEEQSARIQREQLIEEQDRLYLESMEQDRLYLIKKNEKTIPPTEFICPISNNIIETPLRDEDGNCYEKSIILKYLKENDGKNHLGKIIAKSKLVIDNVLKSEIGYWKREHPNWK